MATRRRPTRGGVGSNQYGPRGVSRARPRAAADRFATPAPEPKPKPVGVRSLDERVRAGFDAFDTHCRAQGLDPDTVLAEGRLVHGRDAATTAWRTLAGADPDDTTVWLTDGFDEETPDVVWALAAAAQPADRDPVLVRGGLAAHHACPDWLYATLADDADSAVRVLVAEFARDPAVLAVLAVDVDAQVRGAVAQRSTIDADAAGRLAHDPVTFVRVRLAGSVGPNVPWTVLAADEEVDVRAAVAGSKAAPPAVLLALATNAADDTDDATVAVRAGRNPMVPGAGLALLAESADPQVRVAVGRNPSTPAGVLDAMAQVATDPVAVALLANPSTPPSALEALAWNPAVSVDTAGALLRRLREGAR